MDEHAYLDPDDNGAAQLPTGYSVIKRTAKGYILARVTASGGEEYCGRTMSWRANKELIKEVEYFEDTYKDGVNFSGIDDAIANACWQKDTDERHEESKRGRKPIKVAAVNVPLCPSDADKPRKINVQLDLEQTRKLDGIFVALRQGNHELASGKPVVGLPDAVRALLEMIDRKG